MAMLASSLIFFLLDVVWMAIQNVKKNEDLKLRVLQFGFGDESLARGEQLYTEAEGKFQAHNKIYAKQHKQGEVVKEKFDDFFSYYMGYAKLVRRRLRKDKRALEMLGLLGPRKKKMIKVIEQARQFFNNIISEQDIFDRVSDLGITPESMQGGHDKIDALLDENAIQEEIKSDAQDMTVEKHKSFSTLNDWWMEFRQALINSTKDKPQLLERAGIPAYSPEYLRQKRAKNKADKTQTDDSTQSTDPDTQPTEPNTQTETGDSTSGDQ